MAKLSSFAKLHGQRRTGSLTRGSYSSCIPVRFSNKFNKFVRVSFETVSEIVTPSRSVSVIFDRTRRFEHLWDRSDLKRRSKQTRFIFRYFQTRVCSKTFLPGVCTMIYRCDIGLENLKNQENWTLNSRNNILFTNKR